MKHIIDLVDFSEDELNARSFLTPSIVSKQDYLNNEVNFLRLFGGNTFVLREGVVLPEDFNLLESSGEYEIVLYTYKGGTIQTHIRIESGLVHFTDYSLPVMEASYFSTKVKDEILQEFYKEIENYKEDCNENSFVQCINNNSQITYDFRKQRLYMDLSYTVFVEGKDSKEFVLDRVILCDIKDIL